LRESSEVLLSTVGGIREKVSTFPQYTYNLIILLIIVLISIITFKNVKTYNDYSIKGNRHNIVLNIYPKNNIETIGIET